VTAQDALLAQAFIAAALLGLVVLFAARFATPARTQAALERLLRKRLVFQMGAFLLVAGIAVSAIADATRWLTALPENDLTVAAPTAAGYLLVVLGVGAFVHAARHDGDRPRQG